MQTQGCAPMALELGELERVAGGYVDWETDWCGTRIPGWPKPRQDVVIDPIGMISGVDLVALNPQPLPPRGGLAF